MKTEPNAYSCYEPSVGGSIFDKTLQTISFSMRLFMLFFIEILLMQSVIAQHDSTRVEISVRPNEIKPLVVPFDSLGFAVIDRRQSNLLNPSNVLKVIGYDADMKQQWENTISHNKKITLNLYEYQESKLHLIFGSQTREEVEFYIIDPVTGDVAKHKFFYLDNLLIADFTVINDRIYILGTIKRLPVLLEFDLRSHKVVSFPMAINAKNVQVLEIFRNGKSQVSTTISMEVNKRKQILSKTFDIETKEGLEFVVRPADEYDLLNGKVTVLTEKDKLVIGTYGYRNRISSKGMYVGGYVGSREVIKKYHQFTDMDNFFGFLSEKEQKRMADKVSKKTKKGKDLRLRYRLLVHEAVVHNDQYVMIGEAYYPTYRTERYRRYGSRGYYYDTRVVFDGFKFTHAIVAAIDKRGDLIWNHSFKINDTKTFQLKERVKLSLDEKILTLIYNMEGEIYQFQIQNGEVLEREKSIEVATKHSNDRVKNSDLGEAEYWYDNHFLAWGYQKIKNYEGEGDKIKRNVFYINKLSY